ncbi:MoxR family ATPase [Lawsonibacter sp. OA9]|uniref:AAA family ATPase n=1 Tax=Eubacteriales TaxID=186802 RepID=UPI000821A40B|nr:MULTISPECIES: MoxR family ATPase [Oscillospiraceae]MCH1979853.1 MoxR family ATPase [Lawsonibacter sp. OA9]MCU6702761.1 MoxR family ATPase [Muriventricola aceti]SCH77507.1 ATPase ravA [uncultured Clostridium sp.]SCJ19253.1 ATPase ravA [uncultured Flavonifractor sp.]
MDIRKLSQNIQEETGKIIVGKSDRIRLIVMSILANGHILLDDLPGVGKTTLVKTISIALGCQSGRIQFVPDLLPSDIIGMRIYNQKTGDFELRQGPVMTNLLLADEINRAIPRTQSALLEAMEERQISIDGEQFPLPAPFLVLATQNPVESESTFRLPAAQMDRFLIRISMGYPTPKEERRMLRNLGDEIPFDQVRPVTNAQELVEAQRQISQVHLSDAVADYIVALAAATRSHPQLKMGASPRATRGLYRAAKVWAAMEGRDFVTPDDVKTLAAPVLEHRLILDSGARFSGVSVSAILDDVLERLQGAPELEAVAHEK